MKWSVDQLTDIRAFVDTMLGNIGLRSYVFNVEPAANSWIISVDFPSDDQWQSVELQLAEDVLADCLNSPEACEKLASAWKRRLDTQS